VLRIGTRDLGSGILDPVLFDPRSGLSLVRIPISDSGPKTNNSESLVTIFRLKILKFFDNWFHFLYLFFINKKISILLNLLLQKKEGKNVLFLLEP
jgi:hypothetical protein